MASRQRRHIVALHSSPHGHHDNVLVMATSPSPEKPPGNNTMELLVMDWLDAPDEQTLTTEKWLR
jgi:glutamate-1-semialdehyde aminotransferase